MRRFFACLILFGVGWAALGAWALPANALAKKRWVYCTPKGRIAHTTIPCKPYAGTWIYIRWPVVI